jgi:hypothetical protein
LIQAAVHGATCVAQVRVMHACCPACLYGQEEWAHYARSTSFSCAGSGAGGGRRVKTEPTRSVSALCSLAADLAVMQVLRIAIGLGKPIDDALIEYCGYTNQTVTSSLARNADCPCDHTRWNLRRPPRRLADCTLRELLNEAASSAGDPAGVQVDDLWFVKQAACPACGQRKEVGQFMDLAAPAGTCGCGRFLFVQRSFAHRPAPLEVLERHLDKPLGALGQSSPRTLRITLPGVTTLFADVRESNSASAAPRRSHDQSTLQRRAGSPALPERSGVGRHPDPGAE